MRRDSDYRDILDRKDLDLVINATPSNLHVPITLDLLNHGFNVLCEKPLARTVEEVDRLIEASQKPVVYWPSFSSQDTRLLPASPKGHRFRSFGPHNPDQHRIQRLCTPMGLADSSGQLRR